MAGAAKKAGPGRREARAIAFVKTQQEAGSDAGGRRGSAKAKSAAVAQSAAKAKSAGKAKSAVKAAAAVNPKDDSPKRQGDKLPSARGKGDAQTPRQRKDAAGDPSHDSPKRQGDKLANATRAAAGRARSK